MGEPIGIDHISLKCRIVRDWRHKPCSGTCDGHGTGKVCDELCQCWCHVVAAEIIDG